MICKEYGINILLDENYITELLIESPNMFLPFMTKLWQQYRGEEDFIIFSQFDKELHLDKVAEIVSDPFQIDVNNRKILVKIYQNIVKEMQEKNLEQMWKLQSLMEKYVIEVCETSEFLLTYDANPDFIDLLKMYNVHVDNTEMDLVSRIIAYVKLSHRVLNTSLYIFVNLKSYFSNEILEKLYQTLCYEKINILLIERYDRGALDLERRIIIDKDACVIYEK